MKAGKVSKVSSSSKSVKQDDNILSETEVGKFTVRVEKIGKGVCFGIHSTARIEAGEDYTLVMGMGLGKSKAVLACLKELKAFVAEYDNNGE